MIARRRTPHESPENGGAGREGTISDQRAGSSEGSLAGGQRPGGLILRGDVQGVSATWFSRSALVTTLTEDSAIAAAAKIGESSTPNSG